MKPRNSKKLLTNLWMHGTKKQKEDLLESRGLHKSWAETKSIDEMVERSGGMAVRDLGVLVGKWIEKNPHTRVKWDKR